jgi:hypothetical protein
MIFWIWFNRGLEAAKLPVGSTAVRTTFPRRLSRLGAPG